MNPDGDGNLELLRHQAMCEPDDSGFNPVNIKLKPMTPTDQQLKLALARALPGIVEEERTGPHGEKHYGFIWRNTDDWRYVTDLEWPAVVTMVEEKLTLDRLWFYIHKLRMVVGDAMMDKYDERFTATASWQMRARALVAIGAITVEPERKETK